MDDYLPNNYLPFDPNYKKKRKQIKRKRQKEPEPDLRDGRGGALNRQAGVWPDAEEEGLAPMYERYHKVAKVTEVASALAAFKRSLPLCFRAARKDIQHLKGKSAFHRTTDYISPELQRIIEGWTDKWNQAPVAVPWYPGCWRLLAGSLVLKDRSTPDMKRLADWIANGVWNGTVVRQEEASMIPVALLRAVGAFQGGSNLMLGDICACPGSKTTQLLAEVGSGLVMANDADRHRASVLAARTRDSFQGTQTATALVVTHHDGARLPLGALAGRFDAVVADVPCSGDGTVRKDFGRRKGWSPSYGFELHRTQVRICLKAAALLKSGAYMTYSTCSLHPIEDEAVVAAVLEAGRGSIELVDASKLIPTLKRRPGLKTWTVVDDQMRVLKDVEDARQNGAPPSAKLARATMWPPEKEMGLERCLRVVPHDADTGGFFVALLKKVSPLLSELKSEERREEVMPSVLSPKERGNGQFLLISSSLSKDLVKNIGIEEGAFRRIVGRSETPKRLWMFTETALPFATDPRVGTLNGGLEVLRWAAGGGSELEWQICQEGAMALAPFLPPERVITLTEKPELKSGSQPLSCLDPIKPIIEGPCVLKMPGGVIAAQVVLPNSGKLSEAELFLSKDAVKRLAMI